MKEIPNFIEVYNIFDSTYCNKVIETFKIWEKAKLVKSRQFYNEAPEIAKQDHSMFLPTLSELKFAHTSNELLDPFVDTFWGAAYTPYANKYGILKDLGEHKIYTMKIQKTEPSEGYHIWHCEAAQRSMSDRLLTWSVYLNDDFDAGETEFLYQQYRYKPKTGDCVIFPAAFTHTHRGNPPIGGDKYIITGWVEF